MREKIDRWRELGAWLPLRTLAFLGIYILIGCLLINHVLHDNLGNGFVLAFDHDNEFIWRPGHETKVDHILCIYSRGRLATGRLVNGKIFVFDTQSGDVKLIDPKQGLNPTEDES